MLHNLSSGLMSSTVTYQVNTFIIHILYVNTSVVQIQILLAADLMDAQQSIIFSNGSFSN